MNLWRGKGRFPNKTKNDFSHLSNWVEIFFTYKIIGIKSNFSSIFFFINITEIKTNVRLWKGKGRLQTNAKGFSYSNLY